MYLTDVNQKQRLCNTVPPQRLDLYFRGLSTRLLDILNLLALPLGFFHVFPFSTLLVYIDLMFVYHLAGGLACDV